MHFTADEILDELASLDATLREAERRAGQGCDPDFERRLDAHVRSLKGILNGDAAALALDVAEAARRVLEAADPEAPLLMLVLVRNHLAAVLRRQAAVAATFPSAA